MDKTIHLQENQQGIRLLMVGAFPLLQESWMNTKEKETKESYKRDTRKHQKS